MATSKSTALSVKGSKAKREKLSAKRLCSRINTPPIVDEKDAVLAAAYLKEKVRLLEQSEYNPEFLYYDARNNLHRRAAGVTQYFADGSYLVIPAAADQEGGDE